MFSSVHMECWVGPGRRQHNSQSLTGALWAGHRALATPLFVLLTHSHGWAGVVCWLCSPLLGSTGPSRLTAPLSSWPSEGIGNSWISSKLYSKSGKGCEIKFQISAPPVHTRGLLGRKQALGPLRVWLVLILLQKGQSDPVWANYFPFPMLSLQSSGKHCQHQKCSFLPTPLST